MTKEQFLSAVTPVLASYKTGEGLVCHAQVIPMNEVHAAFDDTRSSDCTCICGRCCRANVGDSTVHWCANKDCPEFQIHVVTPNGR